MQTTTITEDTVMENEVQIKRERETGLYIATYKGRELWIKHDYKSDAWHILEPWAIKNPDGSYRSKRLDSCGRLYRAKEGVTRILKGN